MQCWLAHCLDATSEFNLYVDGGSIQRQKVCSSALLEAAWVTVRTVVRVCLYVGGTHQQHGPHSRARLAVCWRDSPVASDGGEVSGSSGEQHPVQDVGPLLSARPPRVQLRRARRHVVEVVEVELLDQLLKQYVLNVMYSV